MPLILQSHDRFDEYAEFDPEKAELALYSKTREPQKWTGEPAGWYTVENGSTFALFRVDHQLFFLGGGVKYSVGDDVHATVKGDRVRRRFALAKAGQELFGIDYNVPEPVIPPEQDFTQTEPDHFDFFLFVRNMLEDPGRRRFAKGFPRD